MNDNKLIAEFMGIENDNAKMRGIYECSNSRIRFNLEYHTSWDWLMLYLGRLILKNQATGKWRMINRPTEYNIKEVYAQAVRFIKKYNDEKEVDFELQY